MSHSIKFAILDALSSSHSEKIPIDLMNGRRLEIYNSELSLIKKETKSIYKRLFLKELAFKVAGFAMHGSFVMGAILFGGTFYGKSRDSL